MTKRISGRSGGPGPIGPQEPAESAKETAETKPHAVPESPKVVAGNKQAIRDLKAAEKLQKSQLDKQLGEFPPKNLLRASPPYVPVQEFLAVQSSHGLKANGEVNEVKLTADQFQINDQGKLVISNEKLIDFFKSLQNNPQDQEVHLGIVKLKTTKNE